MDAKTVDLGTLNPEAIATWATDATPPEIDLLQSRLVGEWAKQWARRESAGREMTRLKDYPKAREQYADQRAKADGKCQWLDTLQSECVYAYMERGGWTRYYLVRGANGHVHWSTGCSTCNRDGKRTEFAWLTQYSGMPMHEFVNLAGERACTVCFPDAPVEKRSMLDDDVAERERLEKVRADRAQKKQEKRDKGIAFDEDGEPVELRCTNGERPKTKVSADRVAVAAYSRFLHLQAEAEKEHAEGNYEQRDWLETLASEEMDTVNEIVAAWVKLNHDEGTVLARYKNKGTKMFEKRGY